MTDPYFLADLCPCGNRAYPQYGNRCEDCWVNQSPECRFANPKPTMRESRVDGVRRKTGAGEDDRTLESVKGED
jgi:hypothetical protein